jgi:hypothetical protein
MQIQAYDIVNSYQTKELENDSIINENENENESILISITLGSDNFKYSKSSLPYNTYYYSSIYSKDIKSSSEEKINYHIHRLNRKHLNHKFFLIELGSCGNDFGYALRDWDSLNDFRDQDFYLNKTNLNHEYKYHYGKKIIEVELYENTKDLILIVFPLSSYYKKNCAIKGKDFINCEENWNADYMLRYRTSESRMHLERYKLDNEGNLFYKKYFNFYINKIKLN